MIHYTKEGERLKLGLNFRFARGGFAMIWAWYNMPTNTVTAYRFRFRRHIKPRVIREKSNWNVVESELLVRDMVGVRREYLHDLLASQRDMMTHTGDQAYVKPVSRTH